MTYEIESFYPIKVSNEIWNKYYNFNEAIFREQYPEDPLPDRELDKNFILEPSPFYDIYRWLVFSSDENKKVIGKSSLWFQNEKSPDFKNVSEKANFISQ